jgi:tape measure domain-containing protein
VSGSTTTLDLKVTADAKAAVQGLKPLSAALDGVTKDADQTESALKDLDKKHKIDLNDEAIANARKEIARLRGQMRDDLRLDINANTRAAQQRIRQLQSTVRTLDAESIEITASVDVDEASVGRLGALQTRLAGLDEATGGLIPGLSRLGGAAGKLAGPLAVAGAAFGGWKLGEAAADVETMVVQLDALTNGKGVETFKGLQKWAAATPFAIEDATEATKKLLAAGVGLDEINDQLNDMGNIAATTGVPLSQIATVFAQMESKGKATFEELQQLAEAGIPVWRTLAGALGMTVAEVQKLATEGKLSADAIGLARESVAGLFPTAMATQAETFNGQMSTLQDNLGQIGSTLGTLTLPMMTDFIGMLNEMAGGALTVVGKIAEMGGSFLHFREGLADARGDGKVTIDDFKDLATSPLWKMPQTVGGIGSDAFGFKDASKNAKDLTGATDDLSDSQKRLAELAEKVKEGIATAGEAAALKAAAAEAKRLEQALKDTITAFGQIGGTVRTKVSFIITQDDIQEQIDKAVKGDKKTKGIELPAKITLGSIAGLSDQQQDLIGLISSSVETGLQEGSRRAELNPNFDAAAWYEQVRAKTRGQLIEVGVDKSKVEQVLASVFGLPKKVPVSADVAAAQAAIDNLDAPPPITVSVTPVGPWAPGKGAQPNFFAPQDVPVTPTVKDAKPAADQLGAVAKPRDAVIVPTLDQFQVGNVRSVLDALARDRHTTIWVTTKTTGGAGAGGPSAGPGSIVPQLFGQDSATVAGLRGVSSQSIAMTGATQQSSGSGGPSKVTQLAPKQTPVKIYLDGAEIADHLTLKAGRLATSSSVRRRA